MIFLKFPCRWNESMKTRSVTASYREGDLRLFENLVPRSAVCDSYHPNQSASIYIKHMFTGGSEPMATQPRQRLPTCNAPTVFYLPYPNRTQQQGDRLSSMEDSTNPNYTKPLTVSIQHLPSAPCQCQSGPSKSLYHSSATAIQKFHKKT